VASREVRELPVVDALLEVVEPLLHRAKEARLLGERAERCFGGCAVDLDLVGHAAHDAGRQRKPDDCRTDTFVTTALCQ